MGNKPIEMPPIMVCFEDMQHFMALDEVNKQLQSELTSVKGELEEEIASLEQEVERLEQFLHAKEMHPGYEYTYTEGPRKCWGDEGVPPEGEDWERNIARGNFGWERFDYIEESYWRRKKTKAKEGEG